MRKTSNIFEQCLGNTSMIKDWLSSVIIKKRRRAKKLSLKVRDDGSVTLTLPYVVSLKVARQFLLTHQEWVATARKKMQSVPKRLLNQGGKQEYALYKEQARGQIAKRVEYFCSIYNTSFTGLSIRNQKSRFGSCSARGHLSFNYRLIFLPKSLLDYVVAHEVCHLLELNHSQKFWALVARTIPDYQERKRQIQAFSRTSLS